MKKLIVLTGISGVGKTTLAKYIQSKIGNVTVITVDTILEGICEMIGFHDKKRKKEKSHDCSQLLLSMIMMYYKKNL